MNRLHYMDSLRSVLMALGIILHTANIYSAEVTWRISSEDTSTFIFFLRELIHLFRMPAFFMVSGFFCVMTLQKYGTTPFVKVRMKRIALPLVVTALTLNSLQALVLHVTGWQPFDFATYWLTGGWISHLWFLINLIVYFALAVFLYSFAKRMTKSFLDALSSIAVKTPMPLVILIAAMSGVGVVALSPLGFPLYSYYFFDILNVFSVVKYMPFFLFGALLFNSKELLESFSNISNVVLLLYISASMIVLFLITPQLPETISTLLVAFSSSLASWTLSAALFKFFQTYFNKKSSFWLSMSDSSYTIYLFHHLIVICLGLVAIELGLPPFAGFIAIVVLTVFATIGIHRYLISKFPLLKLAFNGK